MLTDSVSEGQAAPGAVTLAVQGQEPTVIYQDASEIPKRGITGILTKEIQTGTKAPRRTVTEIIQTATLTEEGIKKGARMTDKLTGRTGKLTEMTGKPRGKLTGMTGKLTGKITLTSIITTMCIMAVMAIRTVIIICLIHGVQCGIHLDLRYLL
jgi:hypothetical protein